MKVVNETVIAIQHSHAIMERVQGGCEALVRRTAVRSVVRIQFMALFQWTEINPKPGELEGALLAARAAAGSLFPKEIEWQAIFSPVQEPSGYRYEGFYSTAHDSYAGFTWVWWTDSIGRQHWYVEGDEYRLQGQPNPLWRCRPGSNHFHPLWVLASRYTAIREGGPDDDGTLLVVCDCGLVGRPEEVGWTGKCCGPCFDRLLDGSKPLPSLAVHPHRSEVAGLVFTQDGRVFSCGYRDTSPCLYSLRTGQQIRFEPVTQGGAVGAARLPGDQAVVAFHGLPQSMVVCWDLISGEELWRCDVYGEVMGVAASSRGDLVAVDCVSVSALIALDTGEVHNTSEDHSNFAFSPSGYALYAFDYESRSVVKVNPPRKEVHDTGLKFGEPEEDDCYSLACCPTRPLLASGGDNGRLRLGDLSTGCWLYHKDGPPGLVRSLAFTPNGRTLVSGHEDRVVFWDTDTLTQQAVLRLPGYGVGAIAFSPDGETLAIGDAQGLVRLWTWRRMIERPVAPSLLH